MSEESDIYEAVYAFVRTVPAGKVVTYGQVADCVTEVSLTARQVGAAMYETPKDVPWQRVVGAGGHLPIHKRSPELAQRQRRLLESEGVVFLPNAENRIDMSRSQWHPFPESSSQGSLFEES
jgi:methylated-DNA-protein-cysteine methyltransferase related protein